MFGIAKHVFDSKKFLIAKLAIKNFELDLKYILKNEYYETYLTTNYGHLFKKYKIFDWIFSIFFWFEVSPSSQLTIDGPYK